METAGQEEGGEKTSRGEERQHNHTKSRHARDDGSCQENQKGAPRAWAGANRRPGVGIPHFDHDGGRVAGGGRGVVKAAGGKIMNIMAGGWTSCLTPAKK